MDYNDLALSRHLDQLEEYEMKKKEFNLLVTEVVDSLKSGECDNGTKEDIFDRLSCCADFDNAISAFMNNSGEHLNRLINESVVDYLEDLLGELRC